MTKFFSSADTVRSVATAVAALFIAGTLVLAAAGPAMASPAAQDGVNNFSKSIIVRVA